MPHCILEYSENTLNSSQVINLLKLIRNTMVDSSLFDERNIKLRGIKYIDYLVNDEKEDFVHLQVLILSGRTEKQKVLLSSNLLKTLNTVLINCNNITVEIRDIDKTFYSKK